MTSLACLSLCFVVVVAFVVVIVVVVAAVGFVVVAYVCMRTNKKPLTTQLKSYIEIIHLAVLAFTYQRRVEGGAVYANALVWVLIRRWIW